MADDFPRIPPGFGNKNAPRPSNSELLNFKFNGTGIQAQARRLAGVYYRLGNRGGLIAKTNRASLDWLKQRAQDNLDASIKENRRPQIRSRTDVHSLNSVIGNDESHTLSTAGFRFMVTRKVRAQTDYAFSLEYGDRSQIGRKIKFLFLGQDPNSGHRDDPFHGFNSRSEQGRLQFSHPRTPIRGNGAMGVIGHTYAGASDTITDRIVGPREYKAKNFDQRQTRARIKNPVPQYAYGRKAGAAFVDEQVYIKKLLEIFGAGGGNLKGVVLVPGRVTSTSRAIRELNRVVTQNVRGG